MFRSRLILAAILLTACSTTISPAMSSVSAIPTSPAATSTVSAVITVPAPAATGSPTNAPTVASTPRPLTQTLIVAHRGGAALAPENTLAAFENAIKLGVDMVECDVRLSKDGEIIVMHDPYVSRTTNGAGHVIDLTLAEIKKLNAAAKFSGGYAPQSVPTLAELLDLAKGKVGIQIEVKLTASNQRYAGIERKVVDAINARGMADQVAVISFDFPTIKDVKAIDSHIKTGAVVQADWFRKYTPEQMAQEISATTGADYFIPAAGPVNLAVVNAIHEGGLKIGVWTLDLPQDMHRYATWGVDAITTNRPDELKRVLGK